MPSYSIIIPAYNEENCIGRCLDTIRAAITSRPEVEVLVVDNHSTDRTTEVAAARGAQVVSPEARVSISALRNLGARASDSDILIFLDADMLVPPEWLDRVDEAFSGDVQALGFVEHVPDEAPWFARLWAQAALARREGIMQVDFLPGRNICVDRQLFWQVGGFDEDLVTSEDKDLTLRLVEAGGSVVSSNDLEMVHLGFEKTFGEWIRKEFWRQSSHLRMLRKHGLGHRVVRFPFLSLAHLGWSAPLVLACALGNWSLAAVLLALWLVPGLALSARYRLNRENPLKLVLLGGIYWLRFLVAGVSIVFEALRSLSSVRR